MPMPRLASAALRAENMPPSSGAIVTPSFTAPSTDSTSLRPVSRRRKLANLPASSSR